MRGLIAQLVEQSPEKACVGGSNPPQTTIFYLHFYYCIDNQPSIEMKKIYISTLWHQIHARHLLG